MMHSNLEHVSASFDMHAMSCIRFPGVDSLLAPRTIDVIEISHKTKQILAFFCVGYTV